MDSERASLLDAESSQLLQELQESLREISESPELISFLAGMVARNADAGGGRSRLQIELILRSLNPSSASLLGKALR